MYYMHLAGALWIVGTFWIAADAQCAFYKIATGMEPSTGMFSNKPPRIVTSNGNLCRFYCENGFWEVPNCNAYTVGPRQHGFFGRECYLYEGFDAAAGILTQNSQQNFFLYARMCPIDCVFGPWGNWSDCSETCGDGTRHRTRVPAIDPAYGGEPCNPADYNETAVCNLGPCPVDCVVGNWSDWSECPCGGGEQNRSRNVTTAAEYNGTCPHLEETRNCTSDCVVCPDFNGLVNLTAVNAINITIHNTTEVFEENDTISFTCEASGLGASLLLESESGQQPLQANETYSASCEDEAGVGAWKMPVGGNLTLEAIESMTCIQGL